jgi:hypothetical protein
MARALRDQGFRVAMVDSNWSNITAARKVGCMAHYGDILAEGLLYDMPFDGIGRLLAVTPNDEVNALAALHFVDIFGSSEVFQLTPARQSRNARTDPPRHLQGRYLFHEKATFDYIQERFRSGAVVKTTTITSEFTYEDFRKLYTDSMIPLFIIDESGRLRVCADEDELEPKPGQRLIALVDDNDAHR